MYNFFGLSFATNSLPLTKSPTREKDPKTSSWLWDERERNRQKERTEHYRQIMRLQQNAADPLTDVALEDDSQVRRQGSETSDRSDRSH